MINVSHLSGVELAGLHLQDKLYWQGVFSEGEHVNGFQLVRGLASAIESKNLWVRGVNEINKNIRELAEAHGLTR